MSGTAQPIERMLPNAVHFREFQNDPVTGHHYTGTCGETGLATAMVCSTVETESTQDAINLMMSMAREMIAKKWADSPNGSTTTAHLKDEAELRGFKVDTGDFTATINGKAQSHSKFISFQQPLPMDWFHAFLLEYAGVKPIVMEIAEGGQFDSFNGGNDERGVHYHFICIVGINKDGYVCNDGDNSQIANHLVVYPWSEIQQAVPCGLLVLEMSEDITVPSVLDVSKVSGFFKANSDSDWVVVSKTSNGLHVQDGILKFYRGLPGPAGNFGALPIPGLPITNRQYVGDVAIQVFERAAIAYDPKREVDAPAGVGSSPCYFLKLNDPRVVAVVAKTVQDQLAAADAQISDLKNQVSALRQQINALPPTDPNQAELSRRVQVLMDEIAPLAKAWNDVNVLQGNVAK